MPAERLEGILFMLADRHTNGQTNGLCGRFMHLDEIMDFDREETRQYGSYWKRVPSGQRELKCSRGDKINSYEDKTRSAGTYVYDWIKLPPPFSPGLPCIECVSRVSENLYVALRNKENVGSTDVSEIRQDINGPEDGIRDKLNFTSYETIGYP